MIFVVDIEKIFEIFKNFRELFYDDVILRDDSYLWLNEKLKKVKLK